MSQPHDHLIKRVIRRIPVLIHAIRLVRSLVRSPTAGRLVSQDYWINRYEAGGTSGDGSYRRLAEFKAEVLNRFVLENDVATVIEHGCGDGNQLRLAHYPSYVGFDVSPKAIELCRSLFEADQSKRFALSNEYRRETAQLALSLDVIYHLVEDDIFENYMRRLFDSGTRFVVIYSSDTDENDSTQAPHVRHRRFSAWVERHRPNWRLLARIPNQFPFAGDTKTGSFADFYIYQACPEV